MKKLFISAILLAFFVTPLSVTAKSSLNNSVNDISYEEKESIRSFISACADIMRFDKNNYDYDSLMRYVLCTHRNFASIISIDPHSDTSSSAGDSILIVNGDYIDAVLTSIFHLAPEHPPVNALVDRGYCYSNGLYYYRNIFNTAFYTQIQDITELYSLGGGIYYVVFKDIYYENGVSTSEKSFAVIQKNEAPPYSLLRLGMGEKLLTEAEIIAYTPQKTYQNPRWQSPPPDYIPSNTKNIPVLITIISASFVIFVLGTFAIIKELRQK